jgi:hypothetical protein
VDSYERLNAWIASHGGRLEVEGGKLVLDLPAGVEVTDWVRRAIEANRLRLTHPEGIAKHPWRICDKCGAAMLAPKDRPCAMTPGCQGKHRVPPPPQH